VDHDRITCGSLVVRRLFIGCSPVVHWLFIGCSPVVHWLFATREISYFRSDIVIFRGSLVVRWLFAGCSLVVHWLFIDCLPVVRYWFATGSLLVRYGIMTGFLGFYICEIYLLYYLAVFIKRFYKVINLDAD